MPPRAKRRPDTEVLIAAKKAKVDCVLGEWLTRLGIDIIRRMLLFLGSDELCGIIALLSKTFKREVDMLFSGPISRLLMNTSEYELKVKCRAWLPLFALNALWRSREQKRKSVWCSHGFVTPNLHDRCERCNETSCCDFKTCQPPERACQCYVNFCRDCAVEVHSTAYQCATCPNVLSYCGRFKCASCEASLCDRCATRRTCCVCDDDHPEREWICPDVECRWICQECRTRIAGEETRLRRLT